MTTPPPRPVSEPRNPATTDPAPTTAVKARMSTWEPPLAGYLPGGAGDTLEGQYARKVPGSSTFRGQEPPSPSPPPRESTAPPGWR
jgi:hypothetical protein